MKKWKLAAGLASVFVLGLMVGALGTGLYIKHHYPIFKPNPEVRKAFIMKRITRRLDLDAEQEERIAAIVDSISLDARRHFRQHRRKIQLYLDAGIAEMKKELPPDQQERLDQLYQELKQRRRNREARRLRD